MPQIALPNVGINVGWALSEDGWKQGMDFNLFAIDALLQASVIDKDLNAPPGAPSVGDVYIVGPVPTGAWATKANQVTTWTGTVWLFMVPKEGWRLWIKDEDKYYKFGGSTWVDDTISAVIPATSGGTGQTSYTTGDMLVASSSTALAKLAAVAAGSVLISAGVATQPVWGKVDLTAHVENALPVVNGGTNITSYTTGDLLYASAATTLSKLADVATGNALISGGVGAAPSWGKIGLTTHISGVLPIANGGTGQTSAANALSALGGAALSGATFTGDVVLPAGTPATANSATTRAWVEAVAASNVPHTACKVATTANITLSGTQTIDGVGVIAGDRVLVKDQTTGADNGAYVVATGAWTRATDADVSSEIGLGASFFITTGTSNAGTTWVQSVANPTLGTTALVFVQTAQSTVYTGGTGINVSGSTIAVKDGLLSIENLTGAGYLKATTTDTYSLVSTIPFTDISGTVLIGQGGTGGTTAADARSNLGVPGLATDNTFSGILSIAADYPTLEFVDTNLTETTGKRWYLNCANNTFKALRNTAAAGDFSTYDVVVEASNTLFTYMGNTIWHAGNDGPGSGLNADLLDNLNSGFSGANVVLRTDASGWLLLDNSIRISSSSLIVTELNQQIRPSGGNWLLQGSSASSVSLCLQTVDGIQRSYFYADNSGVFGILKADGGWSLQNNSVAWISYAPNGFQTEGHFRSTGNSGWLNTTYGGGFFQDGSAFIKVYGGKTLLSDAYSSARTGVSAYSTLHFDLNTADTVCGFTSSGTASDTSSSQAGVLIQGSGSYGTKIYLQTTDNFTSGMKDTVEIDHNGYMTLLRGRLIVNGINGVAGYFNSGAVAQCVDFNSSGDTYVSISRSGSRRAYIQSASGSGFLFVQEENAPSRFFTNNVERMAISAAGNAIFGIASDDGSNRVQVIGNAALYNSAPIFALKASSNLDTTGAAYLSLQDNSTGSYVERGWIGYGTGNGNFSITNQVDAKTFDLYNGGLLAIRIAPSTNNVLIGPTSDSGYKLDVSGSARFTSEVRASNFFDASGSQNVNLGSGGVEGRGIVAGFAGGGHGSVGYNLRFKGDGTYEAPLTDTASLIQFQSGGIVVYGAGTGAANRTLSLSTLFSVDLNAVANFAGFGSSVPVFTSSAKGLTPASGGGTSNYLRADGSWAVPPGIAKTSGSFTEELQGYASDISFTMYYVKSGNYVTLFITGSVTGTSNQISLQTQGLLGTAAPDLLPDRVRHVMCECYNNGTECLARAVIQTNGIILFYPFETQTVGSDNLLVATNPQSSGQKGLLPTWSITYPIED